MRIIDWQVNIWNTPHGPDWNIFSYYSQAISNKVTDSIIVPTPTHSEEEDGTSIDVWLWKPWKEFLFYNEIKDNITWEVNKVLTPKDPYIKINRDLKELTKNFSLQNLQLFAACKTHPFLDTQKAFQVISDLDPAFVKIHWIATKSYPEVFPQDFTDILKELWLPILIHSDMFYWEIDQNWWEDKIYLHFLYKKNHPISYIKWAMKNKLRVCINHWARLDRESINIINNEDNLMLWYWPDSLLEDESERLAEQKVYEYYLELLSLANHNKIIFTSDYSWNVAKRDKWNEYCWESIKRISSTKDSKKIFSENALNFYNIK